MIDPLSYHNAITVRREIPTLGHSPLEVIADDYNIYFVKSTKGKSPCYYIINEFLCHYLLKCWNIPTPAISAISVDPQLLPTGYLSTHKKHFYTNICFGSQSIKDAIDLNAFIKPDKKPDYKKFYNPEVLFKIALFDIWVENDDRKPTNNNILLQPVESRFNILAIDHAFTFSSMDYPSLNPAFVASSFNDSILLSSLGQTVKRQNNANKAFLEEAKENFYLSIRNCEENYKVICNCIPKHLGFDLRLQNCIRKFLFNEDRNKQVYQEFTTRLK